MKQIKYLLTTGLVAAGIIFQSDAQVKVLPEVTVFARNYKYIKSVTSSENAPAINLLEQKAAAYDVKNSEYYEDEYDTYYITFYLPNGYVLAVYDSTGKLLRTAERFQNVALPAAVRTAVATRFPNWSISKDVYIVNYSEAGGTSKIYKMVLQNGDKNMRVKTNEKGEFL
jgi:hypothetical protein